MRLIDADNLIRKRSGCKNTCDKYCDFARDRDSWCDGEIYVTQILSEPTIDAVPVVRCKDCKCAKPEKGYFVCDYQSAAVLPDWYCWNGERKDDDEQRND